MFAAVTRECWRRSRVQRGCRIPSTTDRGVRRGGTVNRWRRSRGRSADRGTSTIVEMKLREGRNRQIRKMCDACGFDVKRLRRVAIGDLELGDLPHGRWRSLSHEEIVYLKSGGTDETLRKNKASRSRGDRSGDSVRFDSPTRSHASRYTRAGQKKESGR